MVGDQVKLNGEEPPAKLAETVPVNCPLHKGDATLNEVTEGAVVDTTVKMVVAEGAVHPSDTTSVYVVVPGTELAGTEIV